MITSLKTQDGYIYSFIEWELVDKDGGFEGEQEYLLVKYIWAHDNHKNNGCIPTLTKMLVHHEDTKNVQFVGWEREKRCRLSRSASQPPGVEEMPGDRRRTTLCRRFPVADALRHRDRTEAVPTSGHNLVSGR